MTDLRNSTRIVTRSGRWFYLADPRHDDVHIEDIAYALAGINRYAGHSRVTVAQHSVMVSNLVPGPLARQGLLHDAAEAYVGDASRPLRTLLWQLDRAAVFDEVEGAVWVAVATRFGLPLVLDNAVLAVDRALLSDELASAFVTPEDWTWPDGPPSMVVEPWPADEAERRFLRRFRELWPEEA